MRGIQPACMDYNPRVRAIPCESGCARAWSMPHSVRARAIVSPRVLSMSSQHGVRRVSTSQKEFRSSHAKKKRALFERDRPAKMVRFERSILGKVVHTTRAPDRAGGGDDDDVECVRGWVGREEDSVDGRARTQRHAVMERRRKRWDAAANGTRVSV